MTNAITNMYLILYFREKKRFKCSEFWLDAKEVKRCEDAIYWVKSKATKQN